MVDVADDEFHKGGITPSEYTGQGRLHISLFHTEFCTSLNVWFSLLFNFPCISFFSLPQKTRLHSGLYECLPYSSLLFQFPHCPKVEKVLTTDTYFYLLTIWVPAVVQGSRSHHKNSWPESWPHIKHDPTQTSLRAQLGWHLLLHLQLHSVSAAWGILWCENTMQIPGKSITRQILKSCKRYRIS